MKKKRKRSYCASPKMCASQLRPMQKSDKLLKVTIYHYRTATAVRSAGTGDLLTGLMLITLQLPVTRLKNVVMKLNLNSEDNGHTTRITKYCFLRQQRIK